MLEPAPSSMAFLVGKVGKAGTQFVQKIVSVCNSTYIVLQ